MLCLGRIIIIIIIIIYQFANNVFFKQFARVFRIPNPSA